jgi:hypothetical protein
MLRPEGSWADATLAPLLPQEVFKLVRRQAGAVEALGRPQARLTPRRVSALAASVEVEPRHVAEGVTFRAFCC